MTTLIGSVDLRHRLVVRLKFVTEVDERLALIDAGFNGALLMPATIARALRAPMSDKLLRLQSAPRNWRTEKSWPNKAASEHFLPVPAREKNRRSKCAETAGVSAN